MTLGLAVFLVVLGLVMGTGVADYDVGSVPATTVGWLILAAGLVALAAGLVANQQRARAKHATRRR